MPTHSAHILVPAIGTGTQDDPQRYDLELPDEGDSIEDVTGTPSALYIDPAPNALVVLAKASEATLTALDADPKYVVFDITEIPQEPI